MTGQKITLLPIYTYATRPPKGILDGHVIFVRDAVSGFRVQVWDSETQTWSA